MGSCGPTHVSDDGRVSQPFWREGSTFDSYTNAESSEYMVGWQHGGRDVSELESLHAWQTSSRSYSKITVMEQELEDNQHMGCGRRGAWGKIERAIQEQDACRESSQFPFAQPDPQ